MKRAAVCMAKGVSSPTRSSTMQMWRRWRRPPSTGKDTTLRRRNSRVGGTPRSCGGQ
ncbi:hypothetical protein L914_03777 [Phytophthora nicotianae]|uniref:Uncharacterized protein n=1 Tax=Phytophthora nicotianae TaxID=4792 RepID=W2NVW5_PHYNI|nr:hypothetical protein L914_03777 [Phytophthora nicotianae]